MINTENKDQVKDFSLSVAFSRVVLCFRLELYAIKMFQWKLEGFFFYN